MVKRIATDLPTVIKYAFGLYKGCANQTSNRKGKETELCRGLPTWCTYFFMCPYEHITAMECKEVCILGQALILSL